MNDILVLASWSEPSLWLLLPIVIGICAALVTIIVSVCEESRLLIPSLLIMVACVGVMTSDDIIPRYTHHRIAISSAFDYGVISGKYAIVKIDGDEMEICRLEQDNSKGIIPLNYELSRDGEGG